MSTCPSCNQPLPPSSPENLCRACLLKRTLETNTLPPSEPSNLYSETSSRWTPPAPADLAPLFPELEILELLGKGGMGVVYKARQKSLDRFVAVKILPPEIGRHPGFTARFTREAQALARLNHPHIVAIHDFGKRSGQLSVASGQQKNAAPPPPSDHWPLTTDHCYFFLMEFVDGLSLRQLLTASKLAPEEALAIVPQICDALQYAHNAGIVHRDIKPENILLTKSGQVKIADFGLARLMIPSTPLTPGESPGAAPSITQASTLTHAGAIMGTPNYMAPEQTTHPDAVDHRADIYSLGVVFYQMLTGQLPPTPLTPPSQRVQIDVRLDEVVLRTLEKDPNLRYQQATEVKTQIEAITTTPSRTLSVSEGHSHVPPSGPSPAQAATNLPKKNVAAPLTLTTLLLTPAWHFLLFFAFIFFITTVPAHALEKFEDLKTPLPAITLYAFSLHHFFQNTACFLLPLFLLTDFALCILCYYIRSRRLLRLYSYALILALALPALFVAIAIKLPTPTTIETDDPTREEQKTHHRPEASSPIPVLTATARTGDLPVYLYRFGMVDPSEEPSGTTLPNRSPVPISFNVPQGPDTARIIKVTAAGQRFPVDIFSEDMKKKIAQGSLVRTDNHFDAVTHDLGCHALVTPIEGELLLPVQTVFLRVLLETKHNVLLVPQQAVQQTPQSTFVYVVTAAQTAIARPVTVGVTSDGHTQITAGLVPGEAVVTAGFDKLQAGQTVHPIPSTQPAAVTTQPAETPHIQFRLARANDDTTSPVDELPDPFIPGENLKLLKKVWLDQSGIADAAFDPDTTNTGALGLSFHIFLTKPGAEAFAKIPFIVENHDHFRLAKQRFVVLLDDRPLFIERFASEGHPDRVEIVVPPPTSRSAVESIVRSLRILAGLPPLPKAFDSPAQVVAGLPPEAQPALGTGWDEFSEPKANHWLDENITLRGHTINLTAQVNDVTLTQVPTKDRPDETLGWIVEIVVEPPPFKFNGRKIALHLTTYTPRGTKTIRLLDPRSTVQLSADEPLARQLKALHPGDKITVRGTISKSAVWEKNPPQLWILLSDPTLIAPPAAATQPATGPSTSQPATLKLHAAEQELQRVEALQKIGRVPPIDYLRAKAARDIAAAELANDPAQVALITYHLAEDELRSVQAQLTVGRATPSELQQATQARDRAAAATQPQPQAQRPAP